MTLKTILALLLSAGALGACALPAPFQLEKNGVIRIGQHSALTIIHYGENWKNLTRQGKAVRDGKLEKAENALLRMKGTFPVFQGTFQLKETISPVGKDTVRLHCLLESGTPVPTRQLALLISMDPQRAEMRPVKRNGKPFGFREELDEKRWNLSLSKTKSLEIPLGNGTLVLEGNLSGSMVDGRMYHSPKWEIRLAFTPEKGDIQKAELNLNLRWVPLKSEMLDLRKARNMGFTDPVAGDGKRGWSDQGPENDMSFLKSGILNFNGQKFNAADPASNGGRSCLARDLDGSRFAEVPLTVQNGRPRLTQRTACRGNAVAAYELIQTEKGDHPQ